MNECGTVRRCGTCVFWIKINGEIGDCRRGPPVSYAISSNVGWDYPKTDQNGWCGEWKGYNWKEFELKHLLGKISDASISRRKGVSRERIRVYRSHYGIPKFKLPKGLTLKEMEKFTDEEILELAERRKTGEGEEVKSE